MHKRKNREMPVFVRPLRAESTNYLVRLRGVFLRRGKLDISARAYLATINTILKQRGIPDGDDHVGLRRNR